MARYFRVTLGDEEAPQFAMFFVRADSPEDAEAMARKELPDDPREPWEEEDEVQGWDADVVEFVEPTGNGLFLRKED